MTLPKCALSGCDNPARTNQQNSCCCDVHSTKFYRHTTKTFIGPLNKCALPDCLNSARTFKQNSCCCEKHIRQLRNISLRGNRPSRSIQNPNHRKVFQLITCKCGCGTEFRQSNDNMAYLNKAHQITAFQKKKEARPTPAPQRTEIIKTPKPPATLKPAVVWTPPMKPAAQYVKLKTSPNKHKNTEDRIEALVRASRLPNYDARKPELFVEK